MFAGAASLLAWRNLTESLEHPTLHPLERLVLRQLARTERHQVAALDADHDAARVSVGWRDERPIVMAPRGDREPLVGANAQREGVFEHRVHDLILHFGAVRLF